MKKVFILITLLLATSAFSQTPIELGKFGTAYNDSIYFADPSGDVLGDSIYTIDLNMEYEWMEIFIKGNANSPVDTLILQEGMFRYSNLTKYPSGGSSPIIWGSYCALKDSALAVKNIMINNSVGKSYTLWNPPMGVYKLYFGNDWAGLNDRNTTFGILLKRK